MGSVLKQEGLNFTDDGENITAAPVKLSAGVSSSVIRTDKTLTLKNGEKYQFVWSVTRLKGHLLPV